MQYLVRRPSRGYEVGGDKPTLSTHGGLRCHLRLVCCPFPLNQSASGNEIRYGGGQFAGPPVKLFGLAAIL